MKIKILSFIGVFTLFITLFIIPVSAVNGENTRIKASMESFFATDGEILGISSKGEWDNLPENSIPAIEAAAKTDIDFVAVDIKMTREGSLIAFSDDTTERMLDSETVFTVSDTDYSVLSAYKLRFSCGGSNERVSEYSIPDLESVIETAKQNDIPLILRCSADIIPLVSRVLTENEASEMCIIMTAASPKEIEAALGECTEKPHIIGSKKGNVIFAISSYVNRTAELGAAGIELKTGNRYGINYYPSLVGKYSEKMRIIADPTTPEISGFREDSEKWWNDLVSRGYSVIITDHAELFADYKQRANEARDRLQEIYDNFVTNHILPDFKDEILSDIKKAYTDAVANAEKLLADKSSSVQDLTDAYSMLFKAANDVNKNFTALEDGSAGTTVTLPRILLCIAALVVVVVVQVYFYKRRRKD